MNFSLKAATGLFGFGCAVVGADITLSILFAANGAPVLALAMAAAGAFSAVTTMSIWRDIWSALK